ncbi:MAG: hypothetical protein AABZ31_15200, partial [Bdellovibrionota bacterium]
KMKKQALEAKKESEAPVTLGFMREFRAEILSRFSEVDAKFKQVDARIDGVEARLDARIDAVDARFDAMDARFDAMDARFDDTNAKIEQAIAEMKTMNHQTKLLAEEQNLRNRQAYDGYAIAYGAIQDLKGRIKPECLE